MAKKKGLFSWFGKNSAQETTQQDKDALLETEKLIEAQRLETERLAAEKLEAERLEAERLEAERLEAERLEAERLEAERVEAERVEAERVEAERVEAETQKQQAASVAGHDSLKKEEKALGFFARFKQRLKKTRLSIGSGLFSLFKGKKIDDDLFEELEEQLILADIGVDTTLKIIDKLTAQADRKQLKDAEALYTLLKADLSQ
ncbi:MAG: signal recognition particle receptor subunit alpha, partial [Psychromonas sp.]